MLAWALLVGASVGACTQKTGTGNGQPQGPLNNDLALYQECTSVCVRPGDCALAYNDDGICPPGFFCALRFTCNPD